jgi:hypothetical protein
VNKENSTPTVATDHQSVKRGEMEVNPEPNRGTLVSIAQQKFVTGFGAPPQYFSNNRYQPGIYLYPTALVGTWVSP